MATIKTKHGLTEDGKSKLHVEAGRLGGLKKGDELDSPKGFGANKIMAKTAGATGGTRSKRGKTFLNQDSEYRYYMDNETHEVEKYAL